MHPATTRQPPMLCMTESCSPKNKKDKITVNIGLKFKKTPAAVAPNFWVQLFQSTIQITVDTTPVYRIDTIKD